ncbi:tryptophan--tRNA ligase [Desulfurococcus amylolyticus]|uniref:Tryptophan--tRNA ligase n=1 Tax=Desulfurococcus amylolyticus DSM 16532 TaxID=768672 RepID=I3XPW9_DESAM|nr:tryptophan--tRNA ligase [Desulfurococcus amylolyticus]AFL65993.1 tryptophanyl-tRNA synthetase [Desulfurococcus amylolyticus DSM 16532]
MSAKLDPWGHYAIEDYRKLLEEFGISPIDKILGLLPHKHKYFERLVIFGHRDFDIWLEALKRGEKVAVLTGFMPSGRPHLGTAMVYEELKFLQSLGAHVKIAIADAEAYIVRREDRSEVIRRGVEFVAHSIAWGINPDNAEFYYQTAMDNEYYRLIQLFSRKITTAEMEAIYGDINPGKIMAALTQSADILHLQLDKYGGYKYIVVPVGADQDPHLRLTRDIADRFEQELGLKRPSSIYHKLLRGLDGNKMSKSRPEYAIHLDDDPETAEKKLANALTGGRATAEEQRRLGGEPWKCSIFELYVYHLIDDEKELKERYDECVNGKILCGQCKRIAAEKLRKLLIEHQKRFKEVITSGIAEKILKKPSF